MVFDKKRLKKILKKIDKEKIVINFLTALILIFRNFFFLFFYPYKTIRKISFEGDFYQVFLIFFGVFAYFKLAYFLKDDPYPATLTFLVFFMNFFLTISFFWGVSQLMEKRKTLEDYFHLIYTFSYSLLPTLIWFLTISLLYIILPPPRTNSFLGISFSIFFLIFSLTLLIWKLILVFLSLRFSLRLNFYKIFFVLILYLLWFIPYSVILYQLNFFKIPFI